MTVQQLITLLSKMEPSHEVRLDLDDWLRVTGVKSEADYMTDKPAEFLDGSILPENSVFLEVE
jgi:hypothetical protein